MSIQRVITVLLVTKEAESLALNPICLIYCPEIYKKMERKERIAHT
jgi:hypothetical protein